MHALLINRDRDVERLASVTRAAGQIGLGFMRMPAVELPDPNLGCKLSHVQCVLEAARRGWPAVAILEDDVIFRHWDLFPAAMAQLQRVEWDIFYPYDWANITDIRPARIELQRIDGTLCTHFWMIHQRFYAGFLDRVTTRAAAIDHYFFNCPHVRQFVTSYNLAGQDAGRSLLTGEQKPVRWHM